MSVLGPMARGAADLSLLLDVMAGPDPLDAGVCLQAHAAAAAAQRSEELSASGGRWPSADAADRDVRAAIERSPAILPRRA